MKSKLAAAVHAHHNTNMPFPVRPSPCALLCRPVTVLRPAAVLVLPCCTAPQYGGLDLAASTTNIVFSNGLLDPWSVFGVLDNVSDTVVSVVIPDGAHHVDLMFSHPRDTPSIKEARKVELEHIRRWILEHATSLGPRPKASLDSNWGAGEARSEGRVQVAVAGAAARTGGTREGNVGAMLRGGKAVTASA